MSAGDSLNPARHGNDMCRGTAYLKRKGRGHRISWIKAATGQALIAELLAGDPSLQQTQKDLVTNSASWHQQIRERAFYPCKIQSIIPHDDGSVACLLLDGVNTVRATIPPTLVSGLQTDEERPVIFTEIQNSLVQVAFRSITWKPPNEASIWLQSGHDTTVTAYGGVIVVVVKDLEVIMSVTEKAPMPLCRPVELEPDIAKMCSHLREMSEAAVSKSNSTEEAAVKNRKRAFIPTGLETATKQKVLKVSCHRRSSGSSEGNKPQESITAASSEGLKYAEPPVVPTVSSPDIQNVNVSDPAKSINEGRKLLQTDHVKQEQQTKHRKLRTKLVSMLRL